MSGRGGVAGAETLRPCGTRGTCGSRRWGTAPRAASGTPSRPGGAAGRGCSPTPSGRRTGCRSATSRSPARRRSTCASSSCDVALAHRPDLASLIVGVNDTMRSTWDPVRLRADLLDCADALHGQGALLLTARFHDHGAVFGLPGVLRRPLFARIEDVNRVYDEIHAPLRRPPGGPRGSGPRSASRDFWSVDRLHPSELGHRALARAYAELLLDEGLAFELPGLAASVATSPAGGATWPGWWRGCAVVRPPRPRPRAVGGAAGVDRGPQGRTAHAALRERRRRALGWRP